jgi:hypothetical protein
MFMQYGSRWCARRYACGNASIERQAWAEGIANGASGRWTPTAPVRPLAEFAAGPDPACSACGTLLFKAVC